MRYDTVKVVIKGSYLVRESGPRYILHGTDGSFLKWGIDPQEQDLKQGKLPDEANWGFDIPEYYGRLNTELRGLHFEGKLETLPGNYNIFYQNIFNAIRKKEELMVKAEEAAQVIEIIEAAMQSSDVGREVRLTKLSEIKS